MRGNREGEIRHQKRQLLVTGSQVFLGQFLQGFLVGFAILMRGDRIIPVSFVVLIRRAVRNVSLPFI